jgi:ArsR family metal-binding transcriptional regulator
MKNIFIKLQLQNNDNYIHININHIISLYPLPGYTSIATSDSAYRIKESVEEIIEIINKAQKRWL